MPVLRRIPRPRSRRDAIERGGSSTWSLIRSLESSARFHRDGPFGGIFHPGRLSYRELTPRDSLHVIIDGDRVSVHVDDVCPLRCDTGAPAVYSWARIVAHNVSGALADVGRRVRGLHGEQRCNLGCEMVWVDDDVAEFAVDLAAGSPASSGAASRSEDEV